MKNPMPIGKFIVVDGIDGSGTTTHVTKLQEWLLKEGYSVVTTQEPTNRKIGLIIQKLIKSDETNAFIDALLFAADRLDHLENVIKPALTKNKIVISDRYVESSIAYQTAAGAETNWIEELNKFIIKPDLTIILDIDPDAGLSRKAQIEDKFEHITFLQKVRNIYLKRAKTQHYPIVKTSPPIFQVQEALRALIKPIL